MKIFHIPVSFRVPRQLELLGSVHLENSLYYCVFFNVRYLAVVDKRQKSDSISKLVVYFSLLRTHSKIKHVLGPFPLTKAIYILNVQK